MWKHVHTCVCVTSGVFSSHSSPLFSMTGSLSGYKAWHFGKFARSSSPRTYLSLPTSRPVVIDSCHCAQLLCGCLGIKLLATCLCEHDCILFIGWFPDLQYSQIPSVCPRPACNPFMPSHTLQIISHPL